MAFVDGQCCGCVNQALMSAMRLCSGCAIAERIQGEPYPNFRSPENALALKSRSKAMERNVI
jgi:hypothetical protein